MGGWIGGGHTRMERRVRRACRIRGRSAGPTTSGTSTLEAAGRPSSPTGAFTSSATRAKAQHSLMEELGRLTFTNGRSGGPMIDDDYVIYRYITSNWGADGPAMDRLYAFDKKTGELVWSSSPGAQPKDNSFARPWKAWRGGK